MSVVSMTHGRAEIAIRHGVNGAGYGHRVAAYDDLLRAAGAAELLEGAAGHSDRPCSDHVEVAVLCAYCQRRLTRMWGTAETGLYRVDRHYIAPIGLPVELRPAGDQSVIDRFRFLLVCHRKCRPGHNGGRGIPARGEKLDAAFRRVAGRARMADRIVVVPLDL